MYAIRSYYGQLIRDFGVRVKLNLIKELVQNKRVVVVDDSIVRGTTARARVNTLRDAGAKEVHIRVSCRITSYNVCYTKLLRPIDQARPSGQF